MHKHRDRISIVALLVLALSLAGCDLLMSADQRVERASGEIDQGDFQTAAIDLRNVLQKHPDHARARLLMARTALMLGDPEAAEKELRRAVELGVKPDQSARTDAEVKRALGQFDKLQADMAAPRPGLSDAERLMFLGQAQQGRGKPADAAATFQAALAGGAKGDVATEIRIGIAQTLAGQGNFDAALQEVDAALKEAPTSAPAALAKGSLLLQRGQFAEAEKVLAVIDVNKAKPPLALGDRIRVLGGLVEAQLALNQLPEAKQTLDKVAKIAPQSVLYLLLKGRVELADGKVSEAIGDLQKVVSSAPNFAMGQFTLGLAYLRNGDNALAESQFEKVIAATPDNLAARKLLAQARLQSGRAASATDALTPALQSGTQDAEVFALLGRAKLMQGQRAEGEDLLEKGVAVAPDDPQLQLDLAASYLGAGDSARALEVISKVSDAAGGQRKRQIQLMALAANQDKAKARKDIDALVAANPDDVALLNLAAGWLASQKDLPAARAYLDRALKQQPKDVRTLINLARLDLAEGKADEARKALESAHAAEPANGEPLANLIALADRSKDNAAAKRWLDEWVKSDPKAVEPKLELARRAFAAGDPAGGRKLLEQAIALNPKKAAVEGAAGKVLAEARNFDEALVHFLKAADLDPQDPQYLVLAARAQVAIGRPEAARESLGKALALKPNWLPAVVEMAQLEAAAGRTDVALSLAGKLKADPASAALGWSLDGDIRMVAKQYAEASKAYAQAGALKPSQAAAFAQFRARQIGKLPQPEQPILDWLQRNPGDAAARFLLAQIYDQRGNPKASIKEYETLLAASKDSVPVLNNLAWAYQVVGDSRAEATAARAYQLAGKNAAVADTYGWVLFQNGKVQDSLKYLRQAHESAKESMEIQYHLGAALVKAGQAAEGRPLLEQAVAKGAGTPWLEGARAALEAAK